MTDFLFFDTETTGLPEKGANYETDYMTFPHIVQIAWSMNDVMKNYIILPVNYVIPEESTKVHGITTEKALEIGVPIASVLREFIFDCYCAPKIIAHNVYFDTSIIKSEILRLGHTHFAKLAWDALDKEKRVDTMRSTMKFVDARNERGGMKFPRLEELYFKLFNETFAAHDAMEDVTALKRCYEELIRLNILSI